VALSHPLDLIIADLAWPDLDPITFRRALRADPALARIPVLLVGPGDEPADREAVLPKPFNAAQLHTAIRLLLDLS
jgi:CheY-like chemotaxis protein